MVELGQYSLYLLLGFCTYTIVAAVVGATQKRAHWVESAERATYGCFALLSLSMVCLAWAMLTDRFDLTFVQSNSSREQPWPFKLAIWGGQAGSLLLWAWMLGGMAALVTFQNRTRNRNLMPWVIASIMVNLLFFAVVLSFVSNPFELLPANHGVSNGRGMNALLQHPAMLAHPPLLYSGFVGFSVPFSFALAAMITGELGTSWFRTTRRWTLAAWFLLGVGIMLGGRWAYEVLGWGGYWAWDPVENASLLPWLAGTAYLHSVMIQEKRGMLKIWNLALIGLTYSLCIFGTFLTRSGIVQSVHSFANAGWFGHMFLGYVLLIVATFTVLLIWRAPKLRSTTRLDSLASREASFLINNYLFMGLIAVVLLGTLWPAITEQFSGARVQTGPPFFQRFAGPLSLGLLSLTGIGPLIAWRQATLTNLRKSFLWPATFACGVGAMLILFGLREFYPWAFLSLGAFVVGTIFEEYYRGIKVRMKRGEGLATAFLELLRRNQRRYAGYVVHLAVVLMFVGFAGATFDLEDTKPLAPGEKWNIGKYTLEYRYASPLDHPHYAGAEARLNLWKGDEPVTTLKPERRFYFQQGQMATLPAVWSNFQEDFYVILNGVEQDQSVSVKVFINPLVNWIWIGGFVFIIGNTLLLWRVPERKLTPKASEASAPVRGSGSRKPELGTGELEPA